MSPRKPVGMSWPTGAGPSSLRQSVKRRAEWDAEEEFDEGPGRLQGFLPRSSVSYSEVASPERSSKRQRIDLAPLMNQLPDVKLERNQESLPEFLRLCSLGSHDDARHPPSPGNEPSWRPQPQFSSLTPPTTPLIQGEGLVELQRVLGWPGGSPAYFAFRYIMAQGDKGKGEDQAISYEAYSHVLETVKSRTLEQAKSSLDNYVLELRAERSAASESKFQALVGFCFKVLVHVQGRRSLPVQLAAESLFALAGEETALRLFFEYTEESNVKVLVADEWRQILPFIRSTLPDLSNHDPSDSWPSIFDEFVVWIRNKGLAPQPPPSAGGSAPLPLEHTTSQGTGCSEMDISPDDDLEEMDNIEAVELGWGDTGSNRSW